METLATQQICRYVVLLVLPFFAAAVVAIFIPGVKRAISLYKSPFVRNNLFASLFFTALYVFSIIAGGTKPVNRQPQISSSTSSGNVLRATGVPDASPRIWSIDEINLGYALCATTAVSNSLFSAPADALHVRSWTERGYCCAFRSVKAPPEWGGRLSAGVNGTLNFPIFQGLWGWNSILTAI